ncbi:hypothetical protein FIBSPDRAFT_380126 [Athelia psychrophila]|uniref:Uncharacterized protein n=1 Tax=Athelia psychrophila TaxID=1759441 RepID=A0A166P551_9AGAM|nr:hypothetical protein FIBSPDRAFT_380126 [Fibularhizoctonia sp. CBS 109695]
MGRSPEAEYRAGALSTQLTIVALTLHKSSATSLSRWSNNALSTIIKRDGTAACGAMIILVLAVTLHVMLRDTLILAIAYWFYALLSVTGCRLVLNTQDVALPHAYSDHACDTEVELTTVLTTTI